MWRRYAWICCLAALAATPGQLAAQPPALPPNLRADVDLHDIHFLDAQRGWVVGDRGVIWKTSDGGRTWEDQSTSLQATLHSVTFATPQHGWIVGGWVDPYRHTSRGVLLRTTDGGNRWTLVPGHSLPALKEIHMLDPTSGWAVGDASALFPSGVFTTKDGGRSWSTMPIGKTGGLTTGGFLSSKRGVVAGANGQLQLVMGAEVIPTRTPDIGRRPLHQVRLLDRGRGWLVGAGGLALRTKDGGVSWQHPIGSLPTPALATDFFACEVSDQNVWIAGEPGAFVYHSADGGATWRTLRTGTTLPIRDVCFVSPQEGWACGSLGQILHTRDGGVSWEAQRRGGERLSMWTVVANTEDAPVELIAAKSGGEGYLSRTTVLFAEAGQRDFAASLTSRVHEASLYAGGSGGEVSWRFPITNQRLAVRRETAKRMLNEATDGLGDEELQDYLVRQIRQWRPAVVVVGDPQHSPFAALTMEQVAQAVEAAHDPTVFPEHITVHGLRAHRVARLFSLAEKSSLTMETSRLMPALASSVVDFASYSRGLLRADFQPSPSHIALRPFASGETPRDLFRGVAGLQPGRGARREQTPPVATNLVQLQRMVQKGRTIRAMLARADQGGESGDVLVAQLQDLTTGVDSRSAGEITFHLAQSLHRQGKSELAANAYQRLLQTHPNSPLADQAATWLIQYYASGEIRHQTRRRSKLAHTKGAVAYRGAAKAVRSNPLSLRDPNVRPAGFQSAIEHDKQTVHENESDVTRDRAAEALRLVRLVQQTRPGLYEDPRLRFSIAVAQREMGFGRSSETFLRRMADDDGAEGWRDAARAELWLAHLQGRPPKPVQPCFASPLKPKLDGRLDDRVWQAAQALELKAGPGRSVPPTKVWVAYDKQYLYLAALCETSKPPEEDAASRERDTDFSRRDHLNVYLDLDRDYGSYYHLQIDDRGWANERCFGDPSWNPKWFIARKVFDRAWIVEAAIPLKELTLEPTVEKQVWAFNVQRVVPDSHVQSWTSPASVEVRPERFGLLSFEAPR